MAKSPNLTVVDSTAVETDPTTDAKSMLVKKIVVTTAVIVTATVGVAVVVRKIKNSKDETES